MNKSSWDNLLIELKIKRLLNFNSVVLSFFINSEYLPSLDVKYGLGMEQSKGNWKVISNILH